MLYRQHSLLLSILLWLTSNTLLASDHIDGKITTQHAIVDISDLYVFPSQETEQTNHLILVINVHPFAPRDAHFVERVQYNFIIRQLTQQTDSKTTSFKNHNEQQIRCTFTNPTNSLHTITCATATGLTITNKIDNIQGGDSNAEFKVFAGRRADPFFVNVDWLLSAGRKDKLLPPVDGDDSFKKMNVLSIVLSVDMNKLYPSQPLNLLAVSAETLTQDDPQSPWRRLDRQGRPEISNVTLAPKGGALLDQYNDEASFNVKQNHLPIYRQAMLKSISYYDQLDQKKDWQEEQKTRLVNYLLDDFLIVDISKPCTLGSDFLTIESALLAGKPHKSCGGRYFTDDIIDRLFSLYVNADKGVIIRDGVDQPSPMPSNTFPYLAKPENGILATFKAFITRRRLNGCSTS